MIIRYYHTDLSGKPTELTDGHGTVQWRARHDAWGKTHVTDGSRGPHQPLRFQGQYFDAETGLHYNLHRYYDPDAGRFTSQDPIGLRGDVNVYRYAPNPLGWADPLGLAPFCLNFLRPGAFGGFVENYRGPVTGYPYTVHAYGYPNGVVEGYVDGSRRAIGANRMGRNILNAPDYNGQPIAVLACHTGSVQPGRTTAYGQRLANDTGSEVWAPIDILVRNADGSCVADFARFWPQ
jgi:RHS repeat-associated protein